MKVLLTGSSGWLGSYLYPLLQKNGHDPTGLDIIPSPNTDIVGSVADRKLIFEVCQSRPWDAVVHAAALHKPDIVRYPKSAFIETNLNGTLNLLEASAANDVSRFIYTSTTSLMINQHIREERGEKAIWLDEQSGPLEPRNIYGSTKLGAEGLCRIFSLERGLTTTVLRTSRFFPEEDDTLVDYKGPNLKANELLHRRATVEDMARAHLAALEKRLEPGFRIYLVSAPTPFSPVQTRDLKRNAAAVIENLFPKAAPLYAKRGWKLPESIGRVYDGTRISRELGFTYQTTFAQVLDALEKGLELPVVHDPSYTSPVGDPEST